MDVVVMPQLGETVTEGTITAWAVAVGDAVELDDALFEVSTEKVDTEVPAAVAGHVRAILVEAGETVPVGVAVAVLTPGPDDPVDLTSVPGHGDAVPLDGPSSSVDAGPPTDRSSTPTPPGRTSVPTGQDRPLSPVVRRLLTEHDLRAADVAGTGRDGRITRSDVLATAAQRDRRRTGGRRADDGEAPVGQPSAPSMPAAPSTPSSPATPPVAIDEGDRVVEFSRARAATAAHLSQSVATAAHALVVVEVDYHAVEAIRRPAGLSYLPFVARAVVDALREFPHLNASVDGQRLIVRRRINLAVAVDVEGEALVVPVLHEADRYRLPALGSALVDLADRARRRRLEGRELEGGTFTVTNVGHHGTVITAPIINQPQVGIVSTDGVRMKPVAVRTDPGTASPEWGVAVHPVGNLSLSFDHRAVDGAYAAAFLAAVRDLLERRDWSEEL